MIGRRIGVYLLEERLGRGGMGEVYRGYDARLERRVAIKHVRADRSRPGSQERLRREAKVLARLAHPSIVPVFDIVSTDDGDWVVMELAQGTRLDRVLADGPLDLARALHVAIQTADGLAEAHGQGILHRDLKSANVIVTDSGRVRLLDFGLAKAVMAGDERSPELAAAESALSAPGQLLGTVHAMSPEQARGLPLDARSDLFALGVLIYEMTTGHVPFAAAEPVATLLQVCKHRQRPVSAVNPSVPKAVSALVDNLLEKAPDMRPASAADVASCLRQLDRAHGGESASVSVAGPPAGDALETEAAMLPHSDAWSSLRRGFDVKRLLVATCLAIVVGGVTTLGFMGRHSSEPVAANDPRSAFSIGMAYLERPDRPGNIDRAIDVFETMLVDDVRSAAAYAGLARAYWEKAEDSATSRDPVYLQQAEAAAEEAVRLNAYLVDARISRALVAIVTGHYESAARDLEAAGDFEPDNAEVQYAWGRLEARQERWPQAEDAYREAIRLAPTWRVPYDYLGTLLYQLGRYDQAAELFRSSVAIAPDNVYGLRNLAAVYFARGDLVEAARVTQQALTIRPDASLYSNLGTILFAQGLYARAAAAYEDALAFPGSANMYIYWGNLADAYRQLPGREQAASEQYEQAIRLISEALVRQPAASRLLSRRAVYLAKRGYVDRARKDLRQIDASAVRDDAYTLLRMTVVHELVGARDEALGTVTLALDAGLDSSEIDIDPDLEALRSDPEFHKLITARVHLTDRHSPSR